MVNNAVADHADLMTGFPATAGSLRLVVPRIFTETISFDADPRKSFCFEAVGGVAGICVDVLEDCATNQHVKNQIQAPNMPLLVALNL